MVPARSLTLWIPVRGTSGPLQSWFPAVAASNPGTSCFQGSRLSQATALWSSQQDSRGGAWPEATPLTRPLRPPSAFSTVGEGGKATPPAHASASPRPSPTPASPTVPEQHGKATPPRHAPAPRQPRFRKPQALGYLTTLPDPHWTPTYNPCCTPE